MRALRFAALAALAALLADPAAAQIPIAVKGSDSVADCIGSARVSSFEEDHQGVAVNWEALGSSTAFVGLLDGSADIGVSARAILPGELEQASRLGISLQEHALGLDAVAVIVHPSNPISELTQEQLAALFKGETRSWSELGGGSLPVQLAGMPIYSGTHALFAERVLGAAPAPEQLFPVESSEFFEEPELLVKRVASDRRFIGFVGLRFANTDSVKVLAIASGGGEPQRPTPAAIRSGDYLLHRLLYLYTRADPPEAVREFTRFLLAPSAGGEGEPRCVALERTEADSADTLADVGEPAPREPLRPLRIEFRTGSTRLGEIDRSQLGRLLEPLRQGTHSVLIIGHADGMVQTRKGEAYALERAQAIADYLKAQGGPEQRIAVEQHGEAQPVAANATPAGRQHNRRADVYLIPLADAAANATP